MQRLKKMQSDSNIKRMQKIKGCKNKKKGAKGEKTQNYKDAKI